MSMVSNHFPEALCLQDVVPHADPRDWVQPADETADLEFAAFLAEEQERHYQEQLACPFYIAWLDREAAIRMGEAV
jgi:hypothetical protein